MLVQPLVLNERKHPFRSSPSIRPADQIRSDVYEKGFKRTGSESETALPKNKEQENLKPGKREDSFFRASSLVCNFCSSVRGTDAGRRSPFGHRVSWKDWRYRRIDVAPIKFLVTSRSFLIDKKKAKVSLAFHWLPTKRPTSRSSLQGFATKTKTNQKPDPKNTTQGGGK